MKFSCICKLGYNKKCVVLRKFKSLFFEGLDTDLKIPSPPHPFLVNLCESKMRYDQGFCLLSTVCCLYIGDW